MTKKQEEKLHCPHDYIEVASHVQIHGAKETFISGKEQNYNQLLMGNQEIFAQHLINGSREMILNTKFKKKKFVSCLPNPE